MSFKYHGRIHADAEAWFLEQDERYAFSFVDICAVLGLDVGMVRSAVLGRRV